MWFQTISAKVRAYRTQWAAAVQEKRRQRAAALRFAHPKLNELEPRIVPATNQWIGPTDGLWSIATNWSLGHTPQASEQLITSGTPSKDDLASVSVISWDNSAAITVMKGNSVTGQQYISDRGSLTMFPGSTIASDNWVYEYGTISAMGSTGGMPFATVTISSPTVLLEPGSTVTATGDPARGSPDLLIQGTVEQYGALNAGTISGTAGTISITGPYTINNSGVTTIYFNSTVSYSGSSPLYDQGVIDMQAGTLDASLVWLYGLIHSEATGDTITGTVEVKGGTIEVDTTPHILSIGGNLDMPNGYLDVTIGGGGGGSSVFASGSITLGNGSSAPTLNVTAATPIAPVKNSWLILKAGSITGDFGTKNFPPLPPPPPTLAWGTLNSGTTYTIFD